MRVPSVEAPWFGVSPYDSQAFGASSAAIPGNTWECGNLDDVTLICLRIPGRVYGRWQDRNVEDEAELRIRDALLVALGVEPSDGQDPAPVLVVAASLHRLAVGRGLAPRDDPRHSAVRSAGLPAPALALLDQYFGSAGQAVSDDEVRDGLCAALLELSTLPGALRAMNKTRPLTAHELLTFAQIYWNLDAQKPRDRLPIRAGLMRSSGRMAYLKVEGSDEDYADLVLKERADRTPGYAKSAGAFYDRGARLAALVATLLVERRSASVAKAKLRSTRTGRGTEWAIVWHTERITVRKQAPANDKRTAPLDEVDPTVGTLRQLRQTNLAEGKLGDAAILGTTLIAILRERTEKNPGDHESQLAGEYLQTGLTYAISGRIDEALDHFASAERMSQTLAELRPDVRLHQLLLAIARTMLGVLFFQVGRVDEAETPLTDAVALSQALTDEDAKDEDMLAASLSMLGAFYMQTDRPQEALVALTRAATISQKMVKQNSDDSTNQLQLASTLTTLGMLYFQADEEERAEQTWKRSCDIAEKLTTSGLEERMTSLLLAGNHFMLGTVYVSADRYDEAEESLAAAVAQVQELAEQHRDESTGLLLVGAQYMLGIVYALTDREAEAVASLTEAAEASRVLIATADREGGSSAQLARASTFLGSALVFLGGFHFEDDRDDEAEKALHEAVEVFSQRPHDEADQAMLPQALEMLVELYHRQDRDEEAERLLERRRRLDDQSPEAPAAP